VWRKLYWDPLRAASVGIMTTQCLWTVIIILLHAVMLLLHAILYCIVRTQLFRVTMVQVTVLHYTRPKPVNVWHTFPKWYVERFPWHLAFTVFQFFFFILFFMHPASLYCEEHVYMYTYPVAQRLYMNYCCYQIILQMKNFYTSCKWCGELTEYLSRGCRPVSDWTNTWHWTKHFKNLLFKQEVVPAPVSTIFSSLLHSSGRTLLEI
jgi:hypothetical protein